MSVRIEKSGSVWTVIHSRPEARNAMDPASADALVAALERAVTYRRWRAGDIRSILATAGAAPTPRPAGNSLADVLTLPVVPTRGLEAYKIDTLNSDQVEGDR